MKRGKGGGGQEVSFCVGSNRENIGNLAGNYGEATEKCIFGKQFFLCLSYVKLIFLNLRMFFF